MTGCGSFIILGEAIYEGLRGAEQARGAVPQGGRGGRSRWLCVRNGLAPRQRIKRFRKSIRELEAHFGLLGQAARDDFVEVRRQRRNRVRRRRGRRGKNAVTDALQGIRVE